MDYSYKNPLLPDSEWSLLEYIGSENIFKLVFKNLDGKYISPFRKDTTPGCFFWEASGNGLLYFVDYGDTDQTHYNALDFIGKYFNLPTAEDRSKFLKEKFKSSDLEGVLKKANRDTKPIEPKPKQHVEIRVFPRNWDYKDKNYWSKYGITKKQLIEDGVIPLENAMIVKDNTYKPYVPFIPTYAYSFPEKGIYKIYSPYNTRGGKWITNADQNIIGNIQNIDSSGDLLIITKSYKDCRVLRNLGYKNVIWVQSESQLPRIDLLLDVIADYKKVAIFYDNDKKGVEYSDKVVNFINNILQNNKLVSIYIPVKYQDTKDISDFYEKYNKDKTKELIIKIIKNVNKKD